MKQFIFAAVFLSATLLASSASLTYVASPLRTVVYPAAHVYSAHSSSLVTPSQRQYHTQDEFGQYAYGYNEPLSAKQETRSLDGVTRGSYSYRDPEGKLQTVAYTADSAGFHVAATNLPRAVVPESAASQTSAAASNSAVADTVEVAAARSAHLAAYEATKLRLAGGESAGASARTNYNPAASNYVRHVELPQPVEDTPAVAEAKAQHLRRLEAEKLRNEIIGSTYSHHHAAPLAAASNVYSYGYAPLNARVLAHGFYY